MGLSFTPRVNKHQWPSWCPTETHTVNCSTINNTNDVAFRKSHRKDQVRPDVTSTLDKRANIASAEVTWFQQNVCLCVCVCERARACVRTVIEGIHAWVCQYVCVCVFTIQLLAKGKPFLFNYKTNWHMEKSYKRGCRSENQGYKCSLCVTLLYLCLFCTSTISSTCWCAQQ